MDLRSALETLSQRASRYCINLNGLVDREGGFSPLRGSTAVVYRGTLRLEGQQVAIKTFHSNPSCDVDRLKVRASTFFDETSRCHAKIACFPRSASMVKTSA